MLLRKVIKRWVSRVQEHYPLFAFWVRSKKSFFPIGYYEYELTYVNKLINKMSAFQFLDVGANTGDYASNLYYNRKCKNVVVVEPNTIHEKYWRAIACSLQKIEFFSCGVGAKKEESKLYTPIDKDGAPVHGLSSLVLHENFDYECVDEQVVQISTLDDIIGVWAAAATGSLVVKIDVEGYEFQALCGAHETLKCADLVIIEHRSDDKNILKIVSILIEKDFTYTSIYRDDVTSAFAIVSEMIMRDMKVAEQHGKSLVGIWEKIKRRT